MNNKSTPITKLSFFAAANGYSGFRSYFDNIFNPKDYSMLYILKGGPGTGKSRFMKNLLSDLEADADECEAIYCSSDPSSLDGVIIKKGTLLAAVIDGTAPHTRDPIFPGAIDKIINLGENWDVEILSNNREQIEHTGSQKADAYKSAYDYLSIAGDITKKVDETVDKIYNYSDTEIISSLLPKNTGKRGKASIRLVTSYGKDGFGRLDTIKRITDKVYSVVGVYGSEYIFMSEVLNALNYTGEDYTLFPSALDGNKVYALFIPSIGIALTAEKLSYASDDFVIDTTRFLDQKRLSQEKGRLEFLWREREAMLWSSAEQFKKASDEHFKLEKIYTAAMDFSKNDEAYDRCMTEIKKKLCL